MFMMTGVSMSLISFTSHVGAWSVKHCLFDAVQSMSRPSDVASWKHSSCGTSRCLIGAMHILSWRWFHPLCSPKCVVKSEAECLLTGVVVGLSSVPSCCHGLRGYGQLLIADFKKFKWAFWNTDCCTKDWLRWIRNAFSVHVRWWFSQVVDLQP